MAAARKVLQAIKEFLRPMSNDSLGLDDLTDDGLRKILSFLPLKDKIGLEVVCKRWQRLLRGSWAGEREVRGRCNFGDWEEDWFCPVLRRLGPRPYLPLDLSLDLTYTDPRRNRLIKRLKHLLRHATSVSHPGNNPRANLLSIHIRLRPDLNEEVRSLSGQEIYRRFIPVPPGFFTSIHPHKLTTLRLSGLKIIANDLTARIQLGTLLKESINLQELCLDNIGISWIEAARIPLTIGALSITELKETQEECEHLFRELFLSGRRWVRLEELRFIAWPEPANFSLRHVIASGPCLRKLDLRWMMVEPETLATFPLASLAVQSRDFQLNLLTLPTSALRLSLTSLKLNCHGATARSLCALENLSVLERLHLSRFGSWAGTRVLPNPSSLSILFRLVNKAKKLRTLWMSESELGDEALLVLADGGQGILHYCFQSIRGLHPQGVEDFAHVILNALPRRPRTHIAFHKTPVATFSHVKNIAESSRGRLVLNRTPEVALDF